MILAFFNGGGMIMVECTTQSARKPRILRLGFTGLQKVSEKGTGFVKAWFDFSVEQHDSIQSNFGMPVFSVKPNTT
jgi:hypothetical protein